MKSYEDLMEILKDVHIEYEYQPVKYQARHPVIHSGETRTFLKHIRDSSEPSDVLGTVDTTILRLLCYDAKF